LIWVLHSREAWEKDAKQLKRGKLSSQPEILTFSSLY
jgi:hypothetical protein